MSLKPKSGAELRAARAAMKAKCIAAALAFTPETITYVIINSHLSGWAHSDPRHENFGHVRAPRPFTRHALYIYLHECAHMTYLHNGRKPRHVEEYEAEELAHEWMRQAGIPVPERQTEEARKYVARKINDAKARGAKRIDVKAMRFAQGYNAQGIIEGKRKGDANKSDSESSPATPGA